MPIEGYVPPISTSPIKRQKQKNPSMLRSNTVNECSETTKGKRSSRITKSHSLTTDGSNINSATAHQTCTHPSKSIQDQHFVKAEEPAVDSQTETTKKVNVAEVEDKPESEGITDDKVLVSGVATSHDDSALMEEARGSVNDSTCSSAETAVLHDDSKQVTLLTNTFTPGRLYHIYLRSFTEETSVFIPPLDQPVPDNWIVEEDEYVMVYMSSVTHVGSDICLAPDARFDDGIIWMVIIRGNVSRAQVCLTTSLYLVLLLVL